MGCHCILHEDAAAAAKSLQSCLTLCNPIDSPPGSSVPGILQARILEWVAISFSNACTHTLSRFSRVRLCETLWTAAHQAPLFLGFSRQEYLSGLPFPSPKEMLFNPFCALFSCKQRVDIYRHEILSLHNQGRMMKKHKKGERQRMFKMPRVGSHSQFSSVQSLSCV